MLNVTLKSINCIKNNLHTNSCLEAGSTYDYQKILANELQESTALLIRLVGRVSLKFDVVQNAYFISDHNVFFYTKLNILFLLFFSYMQYIEIRMQFLRILSKILVTFFYAS